jgi:hypothetical protein
MRGLSRILVVRCFAALLVCLTASPVTAPFTTCDLSDFIRHHSSSAPHPGQQVAMPGKVRSTANAPAMAPPPSATPFADYVTCFSAPVAVPQTSAIPLHTVLRI